MQSSLKANVSHLLGRGRALQSSMALVSFTDMVSATRTSRVTTCESIQLPLVATKCNTAPAPLFHLTQAPLPHDRRGGERGGGGVGCAPAVQCGLLRSYVCVQSSHWSHTADVAFYACHFAGCSPWVIACQTPWTWSQGGAAIAGKLAAQH
jgi:hypothetical protein